MMNTSFAYNSTDVHFGDFPARQPGERHGGNDSDLRGSDQPRGARRRPVRLPDRRQRHRQRLRQRQVAVQAERPVSSCRATSTCRRSTTRARAIRSSTGILSAEPRATAPARSFVLLDKVGENRLPNFQNLDFHVERPVSFGTRALRAVAGRVQRDQQQHHPGDSRHAERGRTRTRSRRSSRRASPLRRPRELVASSRPTVGLDEAGPISGPASFSSSSRTASPILATTR